MLPKPNKEVLFLSCFVSFHMFTLILEKIRSPRKVYFLRIMEKTAQLPRNINLGDRVAPLSNKHYVYMIITILS